MTLKKNSIVRKIFHYHLKRVFIYDLFDVSGKLGDY